MRGKVIEMVRGDDVKIVFTPDDYIVTEKDSAYFCAASAWNNEAEIYVNGTRDIENNCIYFEIRHEHTANIDITDGYKELYYNIKIISDGIYSTPVCGILKLKNEVVKL